MNELAACSITAGCSSVVEMFWKLLEESEKAEPEEVEWLTIDELLEDGT